MGHHGEEAIQSGGNAEVGIHGGVVGAVPGNDHIAGEPDGESGGDSEVGWLEQVIPLCPYVPKSLAEEKKLKRYLCVSLEPRRRNLENLTLSYPFENS